MTPPQALRHLPLFRSLDDAQLAELAASFSERKLAAGEFLFHEGDPAAQLWILMEGEIELTEGKEPKVVLRPTTPVGELGSLTGVPRNTTAKALTPLTLLEIDTFDLSRKFDQSSALGLAFYRGLLEVVSDKVRRDRRRLDDMRANIIRTQKAMKAARDIVLSTEETSISKPVCDALDDLIENNRRAHYRVTPIAGHDANLSIDANGASRSVRVVELSEGYLKVEPSAGPLEVGAEISGVLTLPERAMPIGGRVARASKDGILLKLDLLIDEYNAAFLGYITQLQLLDFVV
ncbi:MAG: cyclic nucleotide-binding domain-containing protein [Polyangiaceae bacterium]